MIRVEKRYKFFPVLIKNIDYRQHSKCPPNRGILLNPLKTATILFLDVLFVFITNGLVNLFYLIKHLSSGID